MPTLEIIVAVDPAGGFGKGGKIPWACKEDMKHFTNISKQCGVCVMGKNTYHDMVAMRGNKKDAKTKMEQKGVLPDRISYVISSSLKQEDVVGATVVPDLRSVLNKYRDTDQRIAVIGGEKLYIQALSTASVIHMTVLDQHYGCDRFFPIDYAIRKFAINGSESKQISTKVDESTQTIRFIRYERRAP